MANTKLTIDTSRPDRMFRTIENRAQREVDPVVRAAARDAAATTVITAVDTGKLARSVRVRRRGRADYRVVARTAYAHFPLRGTKYQPAQPATFMFTSQELADRVHAALFKAT